MDREVDREVSVKITSFRLLTGMGHMSNTSKQRMKIILRPVINKEPLRVIQSNKPIRVS